MGSDAGALTERVLCGTETARAGLVADRTASRQTKTARNVEIPSGSLGRGASEVGNSGQPAWFGIRHEWPANGRPLGADRFAAASSGRLIAVRTLGLHVALDADH